MKARILLLAAGMTLSAAACSSDSSGPQTAPQLPPASSMSAEMDLFTQPAAADHGSGTVPGVNFLAAALSVGVARIATVAVLTIPTITLQAALSQQPVLEAGVFHWRYSVTSAEHDYSVDFSGQPVGGLVQWEMRVTSESADPPLTDFLWFSGQSNAAATAGEWVIFDATVPAQSRELLHIEWTAQGETQRSLVFTNVNTLVPEYGDELSFQVSGAEHSMTFIDVSAATLAQVFWNGELHSGYIEAPNFNGGVRACWDNTLQNTACPAG